jgi:hypothetical protein
MEESKPRKLPTSSILGILAGVIVIVIIKLVFFKPTSFDDGMMKIANEINKACPIMVDQMTRLDNTVALSDNVFQYNYTLITLDKDSVDIDLLKTSLEPLIINNVKTNPDLKIPRDNKTTMVYHYKDRNGIFLLKITVKPEQYLE